MRPKSPKILFVRRRDYVPNYSSSPKIQLTKSYNVIEPVQLHQEDYFHEEIRVLLLTLRVLGSFPVSMSFSDVPMFKLFSPVTAYSIFVYLLIGALTFITARDYYIETTDKNNFSVNVCNILFITASMTMLYMPLISWFDVKNTTSYLNQWTQFQRMFLNVTNERVNLKLRRRVQFFTVLNVTMNSFSIVLHFYYPYIELWKTPINVISGVAFCSAILLKLCIFRGLANSVTNFNNCFKQELKERGPTPEMIAKYRHLWLQWSQLVSQEGNVLGTMYVAFLLTMLFILVLSLYSAIDKLITGQMNILWFLCTVVPCSTCAATLFALCNAGYQVCVLGLEAKKDLQVISPKNTTHHVMLEVKAFLNVIEMNPPMPSIMGFANMDRALFSSILSATVTYMIVLLQFENGERNGKQESTPTASPIK